MMPLRARDVTTREIPGGHLHEIFFRGRCLFMLPSVEPAAIDAALAGYNSGYAHGFREARMAKADLRQEEPLF
jgi:hypothetical protein